MMAWRGCIEAHHPMAITPLEVAAPLPLDHERTASIHCAATRENTECATRASRATANADGHHASARRHRKPTKHLRRERATLPLFARSGSVELAGFELVGLLGVFWLPACPAEMRAPSPLWYLP